MRRFMSWTFAKTTRMYDEIDANGDKIYQLGIFDFTVDSTGTITRNAGMTTNDNTYHLNKINALIAKYPNIKWYLTIRNDGNSSIFDALKNNTNGAQDTFISEINRLINENVYITGIDINLERGGSKNDESLVLALFSRISSTVRGRGLKVHYDLPAMTAAYTTVGAEKWCNYANLKSLMDSCTIMSYGMSWAGSAPSPISPRNWLEQVYAYVTQQLDPSTVFMGLPAYGFRWQIYKKPTDQYDYRGEGSGTYLAFLYWMLGKYNHTEDAYNAGQRTDNPQPYIPFVGYWDDDQISPYILLDVYDFQNVNDTTSDKNNLYPLNIDTYNNKPFFTAYSQQQKTNFNNIVVDKVVNTANGGGWDCSGALTLGGNFVAARPPVQLKDAEGNPAVDENGNPIMEDEGVASTTFNVATGGTYDIVLWVNFPWWDRNSLNVNIDGSNFTATQPTQWYPLARQKHWFKVGSINLSAGSHTFTFNGANSVDGTQLYGFRVTSSFSYTMDCGDINFTVKPATFIDVNNNPVQAASGYKLTLEALRRPPEYAYVWSDDFRSYAPDPEQGTQFNSALFNTYYNVSGSWTVDGTYMNPSTLRGSGSISIKYSNFSDIRVKATFSFSGSEAGLNIGNARIALKSGQIVLYLNGGQVNSANVDTTGTNSIIARCRGGSLDVQYNGSTVFTCSGVSSYNFGLYTTSATMYCTLLEAYDSYWMQLREAVTVTTPAGTEQLGRINRSANYDSVNNCIYIPSGEEINYRTDLDRYNEPVVISMDWDYLHSSEFSASGDTAISIHADDIGVWVSGLYLVDKDGASICYYSDMNMYFYWMNRAEFEWKLQGIGTWAIGQQDPNFYKYLP